MKYSSNSINNQEQWITVILKLVKKSIRKFYHNSWMNNIFSWKISFLFWLMHRKNNLIKHRTFNIKLLYRLMMSHLSPDTAFAKQKHLLNKFPPFPWHKPFASFPHHPGILFPSMSWTGEFIKALCIELAFHRHTFCIYRLKNLESIY